MEETRIKLKKNPEVTANPLSRLFFCFVSPLLRAGYKRQLETVDLPECLPEDECTKLTDTLEKLWEDELLRAKSKEVKPSLTRALMRLFGVKFMLFGILLLMEEGLRIVQPIFMGGLIRYFSPSSKETTNTAYMNALGVSLCSAGFAILHHPYFYAVCRVGMKMRVAASTLIYRKALRLSNSSLHKTTIGHIVTLLSNDVARFDMCVVFLHYVWVVPLTMIGFVWLLFHEMGVACLAGFAMMAIILPIQGFFGRKMGTCRRGVATRSDKRVGIMSEILNGIRVIKMYAWEGPFSQLITEARNKEMKMVRLGAIFQGMVMGIFFATGHLVVLCAVLAYILLGNPMSAEKVFVAATLFNSARLSVTLFLPFAMSFFFETRVTISRVEEFLLLEDRTAPQQAITNGPLKEKETQAVVRMSNYSGSWEEDAETPTLKDISLEAKPGQLIMVIGPVGCGKSTILSALLGELSGQSGTLTTRGALAYSPQEAWVFSASLRQNILFGLEYDAKKYQETVNACSLKKDLESLPHGDQSLVGDRGVALSGGQKARVNLARAVYRDADIYLLDDPLSAVDAAVSRALFEKCIMGHLKNKIRILVTHQLQYLKHADYVIVLKDGQLMTAGTHDQLQKLGEEFTSILQETERSFLKRQETILEEGGKASPSRRSAEAKRRGFSMRSESTTDSVEFPTTPSPVHDHELPDVNFKKVLKKRHSHSPTNRQRTISGVSDASSGSGSVSFEGEAFLKRDKFAKGRSSSKSPHRQASVLEEVAMQATSMESVYSVSKEDHAVIEHEEERNIGAVSWKVYWGYFKLMAPVPCLILPLLFFTLFVQAWFNVCDWWLKVWANQADYEEYIRHLNRTVQSMLTNETKLREPEFADWGMNAHDYMKIYLGLIAGLLVLAIIRVLWFRTALTVSSAHLHERMFQAVIRARVSFFDNNPVGRILNRFSKDTGVMDEQLAFSFYDFLQGILQFIAILIMVGAMNPSSFIPTVPLAFVFAFVRHYYLQSSRDIKRLESTTRSPLYTHISSTLDGLSTIRAFKAEKEVLQDYYYYQNIQTAAFALFLSTSRWFAVVIDWLCALYVTFVAFISIFSTSGEKGLSGEVALSLFYSIQLLGMLSHYMNQWAMLENTMVSVERIEEYAEIESEAPLESAKDKKPKKEWPEEGVIKFDKMCLSYGGDNGAHVLTDITCTIRKAEKIGIVGRTGAGKSSLLSALFRLTEPSGGIEIDGVNILEIGLHDLRQKISIIPQDPVLFLGSLRKNLDPFDEFKDNQLWDALQQVELKETVSSLPDGFETHMQEGGANLSVGQKQLVCLARALLRRSRILVIDEATANVDPHTDKLIQETIRHRFKDCTVLTIAHRLNTIMDSDRVMILELGHIKEFDVPHVLLQNKESEFSKLVAETGASNTVILKKLAADAHLKTSSDKQ